MNRYRRSFVSMCAAAGLGLIATSAHALPSVAIGGELSTLGVGAQATVELIPWLNLRGTIQGIGYDTSFNKDNTPYDAKLNLLSYGVLLDVYPLLWGPRLSAGIMGNGNKIDLNANCSGSSGCTANNDTIKGPAQFFGGMKFNSVAPYAGLGWSNAMTGLPFYVSGDIGVMFQGTATVNLNGSGTADVTTNGVTTPNVNIAMNKQVQGQLQAEQGNLASQAGNYKYFPVAALTIGWRF